MTAAGWEAWVIRQEILMVLFNLPHPGGLIAEYPEDTDIRLRSLVRQLAFRRIAAQSGKR